MGYTTITQYHYQSHLAASIKYIAKCTGGSALLLLLQAQALPRAPSWRPLVTPAEVTYGRVTFVVMRMKLISSRGTPSSSALSASVKTRSTVTSQPLYTSCWPFRSCLTSSGSRQRAAVRVCELAPLGLAAPAARPAQQPQHRHGAPIIMRVQHPAQGRRTEVSSMLQRVQ